MTDTPKTILEVLKELVYQSTADPELARAVNYYPALADISRIMQAVIGEWEDFPVGEMVGAEVKVGTPAHKGWITITRAQNALKAEQRERLTQALGTTNKRRRTRWINGF